MTENLVRLALDIRHARKHGAEAIGRRQRARLAELVAFARARSPYYRQLYRDLPEHVTDPTMLPVTNKTELMPRFADWVTDPAVTIEKTRAFVDDPDLVGQKFLGRYTVATTSGTSGSRGIFLIDDRSMAVARALISTRILPTWLGPADLFRILTRGRRFAGVFATGGHFAGYVGATQMRQHSRWARANMQVFSVHTPLPELVDGLNRFQPAVVVCYASVLALLAGEQEAGRLRIHPVLVQPGGETLTAGERDRIARAFGATVRDGYAATECLFIAYRCRHGWLHVNSDWLILEAVDADYQPATPGQQSHSVLLTNLANRVQPILRYDLGDSVELRSDPCPCGDPLPAISLQGRAADVLAFPTEHRAPVTITPLALGTLVDRTPGVDLFQIVHTASTTLRVRLRVAADADAQRVWQAVHAEISGLLADHGLGHVLIEHAEEPPEQSPGGKYRTVIPLRPAPAERPTIRGPQKGKRHHEEKIMSGGYDRWLKGDGAWC